MFPKADEREATFDHPLAFANRMGLSFNASIVVKICAKISIINVYLQLLKCSWSNIDPNYTMTLTHLHAAVVWKRIENWGEMPVVFFDFGRAHLLAVDSDGSI